MQNIVASKLEKLYKRIYSFIYILISILTLSLAQGSDPDKPSVETGSTNKRKFQATGTPPLPPGTKRRKVPTTVTTLSKPGEQQESWQSLVQRMQNGLMLLEKQVGQCQQSREHFLVKSLESNDESIRQQTGKRLKPQLENDLKLKGNILKQLNILRVQFSKILSHHYLDEKFAKLAQTQRNNIDLLSLSIKTWHLNIFKTINLILNKPTLDNESLLRGFCLTLQSQSQFALKSTQSLYSINQQALTTYGQLQKRPYPGFFDDNNVDNIIKIKILSYIYFNLHDDFTVLSDLMVSKAWAKLAFKSATRMGLTYPYHSIVLKFPTLPHLENLTTLHLNMLEPSDQSTSQIFTDLSTKHLPKLKHLTTLHLFLAKSISGNFLEKLTTLNTLSISCDQNLGWNHSLLTNLVTFNVHGDPFAKLDCLLYALTNLKNLGLCTLERNFSRWNFDLHKLTHLEGLFLSRPYSNIDLNPLTNLKNLNILVSGIPDLNFNSQTISALTSLNSLCLSYASHSQINIERQHIANLKNLKRLRLEAITPDKKTAPTLFNKDLELYPIPLSLTKMYFTQNLTPLVGYLKDTIKWRSVELASAELYGVEEAPFFHDERQLMSFIDFTISPSQAAMTGK